MRGVIISVLATAVALGSPPFLGGAYADEAYVCEGGRVAYVRFGELEAMKRKDPCVAAYYGDASLSSGSDQAVDTGPDARAGQTQDGELPVVRTAGSRPVATGTRPNAVPASKEMPRIATPPAPVAVRRVATSAPVARAPAPLPVAHPETDFRNVRILNAAPGESSIFRHAR